MAALGNRGSKSMAQKRVATNKTERVALVAPEQNSPGKKKGLKSSLSVASTAPSSMGRTQSKWIT